MSDDDADPVDDQPEELPDDALPTERATVDAGSRRSYRKQQVANEIERRQAEEFWRGVFADPVGRQEMWRILAEAHAFEDRFACGPNGFPQVEATWFQAGQQALGQRLFLSWSRLDRAGVFLMLDEYDPRFKRPEPARKARS